MRKTITLLSTIGITLGLLANCAVSAPGVSRPGVGLIYQDVTTNATLINKDTSENESIGAKSGKACAYSILGLVAWGDAGIRAAARNGGITKVKAMDMENFQIVGPVWMESCTLVHGD